MVEVVSMAEVTRVFEVSGVVRVVWDQKGPKKKNKKPQFMTMLQAAGKNGPFS